MNIFVISIRQKNNVRLLLFFQVMLIGDSGVGKTCVLIRFKDGAFLSGSFISTVGIDFRVRNTLPCVF